MSIFWSHTAYMSGDRCIKSHKIYIEYVCSVCQFSVSTPRLLYSPGHGHQTARCAIGDPAISDRIGPVPVLCRTSSARSKQFGIAFGKPFGHSRTCSTSSAVSQHNGESSWDALMVVSSSLVAPNSICNRAHVPNEQAILSAGFVLASMYACSNSSGRSD